MTGLPRILRPAFDAQEPIPAGTYSLERTIAETWLAHCRHHAGCWRPVVVAAWTPRYWRRFAEVFVGATIQHQQDWRATLQSIHNATEPQHE